MDWCSVHGECSKNICQINRWVDGWLVDLSLQYKFNSKAGGRNFLKAVEIAEVTVAQKREREKCHRYKVVSLY